MRRSKPSLCLAIGMSGWLALTQSAAAQAASALDYAELAAVGDGSGELQLFAIRRDSEIERRSQRQAGGSFSDVEVLGGQGRDIAAVQLSDASLDVFIVGMDSALWENQRDAEGNWSGWIRLGGDARHVAAVRGAGDAVSLLSIAADGELELRRRSAPSEAWSAPQALGFSATRLSAVADATGERLSLFVVGPDLAVWRTTLDPAAPSRSEWQDLGGLVRDIALARTPDGAVEAVVAGDDRAVWRHVELDGEHVGWERVGGELVRVDLARSGDAVQLFGVTPDAGVTVASFGAAAEWSAFEPLRLVEPVVPQPLDSTLRGQVQLAIPSLDVAVERELSFDVRFSADRTRVDITAFAPIVTEAFDTPLGSNVTTVTWVGGGSGSYDASSGRLEIPVTLHFDQSLVFPLVNTDVDARLTLSTAAEGGAPLDPETGALTLAAQGTFTGSGANPLTGSAVRIVLPGTIDARP